MVDPEQVRLLSLSNFSPIPSGLGPLPDEPSDACRLVSLMFHLGKATLDQVVLGSGECG
jgi:hypothetical protein